ncbi:AtuA-related protein [Algihabitans albus]|uniref:AtuA-related protein n=1 Tax=Algihabitans albus TaxID=2164067 RepID=UPI002E2628B5
MTEAKTVTKTGAALEPGLAVPLHRLAHARAGDKGNRLSVSVIAYHPDHYDLLRAQVTSERVRALFAGRRPGPIARYELPLIGALNFVLDDVLEGGVNRSLNLDSHGKTLSFRILAMPIEIPRDHPAAKKEMGGKR